MPDCPVRSRPVRARKVRRIFNGKRTGRRGSVGRSGGNLCRDRRALGRLDREEGQGVVDDWLSAAGQRRNIVVRTPHFAQLPYLVAGSLLVLTTGRRFCERYLAQYAVKILKCPVAFPTMNYYQLWHDLTHHSAANRWLREQVREVVRNLPSP